MAFATSISIVFYVPPRKVSPITLGAQTVNAAFFYGGRRETLHKDIFMTNIKEFCPGLI